MSSTQFRYRWYASGDLNAFFALALDNLALLAAMSGILIGVFHLPPEIVLGQMVPGTAIGVLFGDLSYAWLAFRLATREQRQDVCAMPFGIDTPSLFALCFGVVGPAFVLTQNAERAWAIGMAVLVIMGVAKVLAAFFGEALRRSLPATAMIAVISAVAVVLIMFFPFTQLMAEPVGGMVALGVVLLCLIGRARLPPLAPAVLLAVAAGGLAIVLAGRFGYVLPARPQGASIVAVHWPWPNGAWWDALPMAWRYLPLALPVALATVIGGIDNVASAHLAGDRYDTRSILLVEGLATLGAALCGGVIQNTPYIGHPAFKQMGARAGYTVATGLFIGLGAATGIIGLLLGALPESLLVPILVFVGLEMAAQAALVTPSEYARAVPLAYVPVIAYLVNLQIGAVLADAHVAAEHLSASMQATLLALQMLGNGFILSAMLWVTLVVWMIDGKTQACALLCVVAAALTACGLIHSPFADGRLFLPDRTVPSAVFALSGSYLLLALACLGFGRLGQSPRP